MSEQNQPYLRKRMTILGDVAPASFLPWIERHAAKLGLAQMTRVARPDRIELDITGSVELMEMMEMGCFLGPIDVWVEEIHWAPAGNGSHQI